MGSRTQLSCIHDMDTFLRRTTTGRATTNTPDPRIDQTVAALRGVGITVSPNRQDVRDTALRVWEHAQSVRKTLSEYAALACALLQTYGTRRLGLHERQYEAEDEKHLRALRSARVREIIREGELTRSMHRLQRVDPVASQKPVSTTDTVLACLKQLDKKNRNPIMLTMRRSALDPVVLFAVPRLRKTWSEFPDRWHPVPYGVAARLYRKINEALSENKTWEGWKKQHGNQD